MPTATSALAIWIMIHIAPMGGTITPAYFSSKEKCEHAAAIVRRETAGKAFCVAQ